MGDLMKWPRGRYNGQRIVGVRVTVALNVIRWHWWPIFGQHCGAFHWLCIYSWWSAEYRD